MIGIVGLGFVGSSISKSFKIKGVGVCEYDKYKKLDNIEELLKTDFVFLCLPTQYDYEKKIYNKDAIYENCNYLNENNYKGIVVLKSTVEPETTEQLNGLYPRLKILHNPEFLSAKTAFEDFHNQNHIVIGRGPNCGQENVNSLKDFYNLHYPKAEISLCESVESESMKIFCNSFYASKIMIFNELYLLCEKNNSDFQKIKELMLKNKWINPMHTQVPGTDGKLGFGGDCFPKDINALCSYMISKKSENGVIKAVIDENKLRFTGE